MFWGERGLGNVGFKQKDARNHLLSDVLKLEKLRPEEVGDWWSWGGGVTSTLSRLMAELECPSWSLLAQPENHLFVTINTLVVFSPLPAFFFFFFK